MGKKPNHDIWQHAVASQRCRLGGSTNWFPYPAIISLGLVTVFFGHLLFDMNPRIRSKADVISFNSELKRDGGIWLSVYLKDGNIVVASDDRKQFVIPVDQTDPEAIASLTAYLKKKAVDVAIDVAVQSRIDPQQTIVTIAADQHLKYFHIHPIFNAMALAGISHYAFETKMLLSDAAAKQDRKP